MALLSEVLKLKSGYTGSEIKTLYEAEANTNAYTDTEKTKLAGVESGATADQTANEILTAIKTVDGIGSGLDADTVDGLEATAFATAAQGSKADVLYYQPTTTKTTTYSAISGEEVRCDTTGGAFTVSLPVTGRVRIIDVGGTSDTTGFGQHNLTLTPQPGDTIAGETDLVLDVGLTSITLVYISGNWVVIDLNGAAFTTIDWGDITNKPSVVETTGDQTISGTKTFSTALVLPNNSRINGVEHFYQTTKPTTRGDSSALVAGDRWWKTDDGTEWFWNGTYWLGDPQWFSETFNPTTIQVTPTASIVRGNYGTYLAEASIRWVDYVETETSYWEINVFYITGFGGANNFNTITLPFKLTSSNATAEFGSHNLSVIASDFVLGYTAEADIRKPIGIDLRFRPVNAPPNLYASVSYLIYSIYFT